MKTIAVIGSLFFWDNIKEYFKEFPKVQFIHFPYTVPEESVGLIDEAASKSDILLFAGSIPYYYCYKKNTSSKKYKQLIFLSMNYHYRFHYCPLYTAKKLNLPTYQLTYQTRIAFIK